MDISIHFSKVSRVVKGVGLKHQCVSFVGSNPTPCIFRHQSIIYLLTANVNKTHFSFLKISFSIEDSNINSLHQLSWLERCAYNAKVAGSNPAWSNMPNNNNYKSSLSLVRLEENYGYSSTIAWFPEWSKGLVSSANA